MSDPDGRKAWFDGLYVQVDGRTAAAASVKYGFSVTYTLGQAEQTGGDLFSLDFPTGRRLSPLPDRQRRTAPPRDDRHLRAAVGLHREHVHHARDRGRRTRSTISRRAAASTSACCSATAAGRNSSRSSFPTPGPIAASTCRWRRPSSSTADTGGVVDLPGLQHLQLRQLLRLPGIHPDAAGDEPELTAGRAA